METVTLVHGFLGDLSDWDEVIAHLDMPCQPIGLDDPITEPTILIGYSMGGRLALHHAKQSPHLIKKLIVISANPGIEEPGERLKQDQAWIQLLDDKGLDAFLSAWYAQPIFDTLDIDRIIAKRKKLSVRAIKHHLNTYSIARQPSLWSELDAFPMPIDFLFGALDTAYLPIANRLHPRFPVTLLAGCGHALHIEDPKQCAETILSCCN